MRSAIKQVPYDQSRLTRTQCCADGALTTDQTMSGRPFRDGRTSVHGSGLYPAPISQATYKKQLREAIDLLKEMIEQAPFALFSLPFVQQESITMLELIRSRPKPITLTRRRAQGFKKWCKLISAKPGSGGTGVHKFWYIQLPRCLCRVNTYHGASIVANLLVWLCLLWKSESSSQHVYLELG